MIHVNFIAVFVAAVAVFLFGLRRLPSRATTRTMVGPLLLWFCLLLGGVAIWTWAAHVR